MTQEKAWSQQYTNAIFSLACQLHLQLPVGQTLPADLQPLSCSVSSKGVLALLASQPNLCRLSLYWDPVVNDAVLLSLCGSCTSLTHVNLSGCSAITDDGVCTLTASLPGLVSLDLTRYQPLATDTLGLHDDCMLC